MTMRTGGGCHINTTSVSTSDWHKRQEATWQWGETVNEGLETLGCHNVLSIAQI
jgi:hypothetical protein